jgi:hypothetical protein
MGRGPQDGASGRPFPPLLRGVGELAPAYQRKQRLDKLSAERAVGALGAAGLEVRQQVLRGAATGPGVRCRGCAWPRAACVRVRWWWWWCGGGGAPQLPASRPCAGGRAARARAPPRTARAAPAWLAAPPPSPCAPACTAAAPGSCRWWRCCASARCKSWWRSAQRSPRWRPRAAAGPWPSGASARTGPPWRSLSAHRLARVQRGRGPRQWSPCLGWLAGLLRQGGEGMWVTGLRGAKRPRSQAVTTAAMHS